MRNTTVDVLSYNTIQHLINCLKTLVRILVWFIFFPKVCQYYRKCWWSVSSIFSTGVDLVPNVMHSEQYIQRAWSFSFSKCATTSVSERSAGLPFFLTRLSRRLKWAFLIACRPSVRKLLIFFSRTTGPISTKLGTKHPWVEGIQVYSNGSLTPFPQGR